MKVYPVKAHLGEESLLTVDNLRKFSQETCRNAGIRPSGHIGQNFLINEDIYDKIVDSAQLKKDDIILEVGPGLGFLTKKLAEKSSKVIAVELDKKIFGLLVHKTKKQNIEFINADILDFIGSGEYNKIAAGNFKIVANLPYNISSIFLRKVLSYVQKPKSMILMLQKEVAERITANPPKMSKLSVSTQYYSQPKILFFVEKNNFWPEPKVDSAVIKIDLKNQKIDRREEKRFFQIMKFGFSSKRKMLKNNLAAGLRIDAQEAEKILAKAGFDIKIRAQELGVSDWKNLCREIENDCG